jgi:hypothetical protein
MSPILYVNTNIAPSDTWNLSSIEAAWSKDTPLEQKGSMTYAASKTEQERTAWKWVKDNAAPFVLNSVLPNVNVGCFLLCLNPVNKARNLTGDRLDRV